MFGGESPKHISANLSDIAPIVIMPGDPLRAKYIAKKYLENVTLVSKVRNMLAFTGEYKGIRVTVMGHGMGMPSISIYVYELFKFYNVEKIIRIGTCGVVNEIVDVSDIVVASDCYTESNFAFQYDGGIDCVANVSENLTNTILNVAKEKQLKVHYGTVMTADVFGPYVDVDAILNRVPKNINLIAEEMEAYALAYIAKKMNRDAAVILTAVDSKFSEKVLTIEEREKTLDDMITLALDSIII